MAWLARSLREIFCVAGVWVLAGCASTPVVPDISAVPVVPVIDAALKAHLRAILDAGLTKGNRPDVFSKAGDSITDTPAFVAALHDGEVLYGDFGYLKSTVDYYRQTTVREVEGRPENSFNLHSFAALAGWKSSDLLDPGSRFWEPLCGAHETPLACELRNTRPSVALILIGSNDVGVTPPDDYRSNMREILRLTRSFGVIPVLSTLPPQSGAEEIVTQVGDYNRIVLEVAVQNNVPIWNYWLAMQSLPDMGLSSDGLHPSFDERIGGNNFTAEALQYGFAVRSLTALQVLAKIKAVVLDDGPPDS